MGTVPAEIAKSADANIFRFDQSGTLLRKVMESAAVGMTLIGVDGRILYVNRAFEAMLGLEPGSCLGVSSADLLFEEDRQTIRLRIAQLLAGEVEEFRAECRMRHADGSPIWALATASLLRSDTTNRPLYAIIQVINIDRQKRAEAALAETESRWNSALESAGQGVWDHDIRKDDMFYSRMWRKMRGIPEGEYIDPAQPAWLARLHPDDVPRVLSTVEKQDAGEDGYDTLEYRERHRDGHWMWILSRGKPIEWDKDGKPLRTVGTDTDITRVKLAEASLAEEKERFRVTLDSIGEGVIAADAEGLVQYMNPVAEALTGWSESDAIGTSLTEVFETKHEPTGEPVSNVMAACLASGGAREIEDEVILVARDRTGRGVSGTASPVRDQDGHTIGAVLVFKDVTDVREEQRRLTHSANHDVLTGLPNRSAFGRVLADACRTAASGHRSHALLFIDLDRFKPVNDSAGHAAGDQLLKLVASVIRSSCRAQDFAARLGGDEFVVLLSDCPLANARKVAQKIVDSVAGIEFSWNDAAYSIGASVGIAPLTADTEGDVLATADAACYVAKAQGRGRVAVAGN
jgi:diguanylate cyclase (GGDEF)-like protein/PAS domain S-box-containing protein